MMLIYPRLQTLKFDIESNSESNYELNNISLHLLVFSEKVKKYSKTSGNNFFKIGLKSLPIISFSLDLSQIHISDNNFSFYSEVCKSKYCIKTKWNEFLSFFRINISPNKSVISQIFNIFIKLHFVIWKSSLWKMNFKFKASA